ncbi:MATE family efflux transporter [Anaerobacillus sp. CMMVII]|uniref:MATE family efflux transporter n=1 Tax=Anaerobacillus sp. CMMVII TaxID=2755588 RepID=UPI0021B7A924|nr:MATE family efflux transporter [Anaerobacillus sp. CMMVII]MCT8137033.1 MATE family efflux transporter [Anaerobacillus sp. CMMVII]
MNTLAVDLSNNRPALTNRKYLALAIPLIISTLTTPLLGAVDTAVVGHLSDPVFIGGVAVGSLIFSQLYWLLGFLRVSTSGFTAQAKGANNREELFYSFIRPFLLAAMLGCFFLLIQSPIKWVAFSIIQSSEGVYVQAANYFDIRIWGAPFALINYVILGWLVGSSQIRITVFSQIFINVLNIILNVVFVLNFNLGVQGVALASLIAEISSVVIGLVILWKLNMIPKDLNTQWKKLFQHGPFVKMLQVNRDLFIRTVCLLTVFTMFTSKSGQMGEVELAANAILYQLHLILAYFISGFSNASSILIGRAVGGKQIDLYDATVKMSAKWGGIAAVTLTLLLLLFSDWILPLFTSIEEVLLMANQFMYWLLLFPLVSFWGLQLYGIFTGATEGRPLRNSIILSLLIFLISYYVFVPILGNHGLWLAFILFSLARSIFLWPYLLSLKSKCFTNGVG